ncbi:apoptosis inhibitor 5 isoform X2 [Brachionus plicatilis]|uniref:Apoptosis inhibitor 5 isoform X2 n=1 Tax=Brachionus plicatilis TaxID=10195 RepID=A0A3M7S524_BRAPC|nr:apoptosis inhibitor 5 isoform X2 [Brachionus plicatilis]
MSSIPVEVTIDDLYKYYDVLAEAKDNAGQHAETYLNIVKGTKAGTKEKLLASQFISRFFKYFPTHMPLAIDAIFDLCEDPDVNIRKSAIKDLASIAKDCSVEHLNRIADILTQLLQTEDVQEFNQVQLSLTSIIKLNPRVTLNEMFNQINTAELDQVRKRGIKFLCGKLPQFFSSATTDPSCSIFNKEIEDLLVKNVKRALSDCDAEEFIMFIRLLASLSSMNSLQGRQELVAIIMEQSELDKKFSSDDLERIMILLSCIQQAIPLFSKNVNSNKYVLMFVDNVLGTFDQIVDEEIKFEILKSLADLCSFFTWTAGMDKVSDKQMDTVYNILLGYLPKPPAEAQTSLCSDLTEDVVDKDKGEHVRFNFSYVECLIYTFHVLARSKQEFLSADQNKDKLKDFRLRLQYFAKGTKNYIKELRNTLINSSLNAKTDADNEENKIRRVALKVTTNIDALIKDLFHNPPAYKTSITLSWKSSQSLEAQDSQQPNKQNKRSLSVTNDSAELEGSAKKKPERGIYQPPTGKYSTQNASNGKRRTLSFDNQKAKNSNKQM